MNREQRRTAGRGQSDERVVITGLVAHFENGQYAQLDINKIEVIDKSTGRPLFDEVLDAESPKATTGRTKPSHDEFPDERTSNKDDYSVTFDTPEGKMEYVKKDNWSGVRKAR